MTMRNLTIDGWFVLDGDLDDAVVFDTRHWLEWRCPDHQGNSVRWHPGCANCDSGERESAILERAHRTLRI